MERFATWIQEHLWLALAGFVGMLCVYLFFTALIPRTVASYHLYHTWQEKKDKVASVENWEVDQARLISRKQRLQERFANLYVSLPRSDHMSTVLQVLQASAEAENLTMQEVRPTERATFSRYDELPFQVEVSGSFHALGAFINRIEQSSYVIKVKQFGFQRASGATLQARLVLSVIILKDQADT